MASKKTAAKKPAVGKVRAKAGSKTKAKRAPRTAAAATKPKRPPATTKRALKPAAKPKAVTLPALMKVGREILGITELRPGQAEALRHILAARDVLAVMPTGSGKSLLYQLPSLVLPGLTVVVSPLLALITDQVKKMQDKGVAIARVDSTLTVKQKREMMALVDAPGGKLLLTTPERMSDPEFRKLLLQASGKVGVSRFVVDEAHCVSQWGHDFRPSYLTLRQAIEDLGRPPTLATTATAPPHVRDDILFQLGMPKAKIVTTSFDRPNLSFEVITCPGEDDKKKILVTLLKKLKRPGIVYCATVKAVEKLGEDLARHGVPVATYHGRMNKSERDDMQSRFMASRTQRHGLVMVATNAFGLGVDKADIRYVLHYHVPGSLEQYAQEAGRGGRDGLPARCVLLFSPDDVAIQEHFLKGTYPTRRQVLAVFDTLAAWGDRAPTLAELATSSHVGAQRTRTVLALLKDEGWVVEERGGHYHLPEPPPDRDAVRERAMEYEKRRIADRRRLDALLEYVRTSLCRNTVILDYLGEKIAKTTRCGRCDNCLRSAAEARAAAAQAERLEAELVRWSREAEGDLEEEPEDTSPRVRMISLDEPAAPARAPEVLPPETDIVEDIDRTAAELVEEGHDDETSEITVLKRRKRAPVEGPRSHAAGDAAQGQGQGQGKKKRRKRRKKGKGGAPLGPVVAGHPPAVRVRTPPSVVFTSPVAVMMPGGNGHPPPAPTAATPAPNAPVPVNAAPHHAPAAASSRGAKAGPIVEYVRRPMKIAMAPVASATPHDTPLARKKHKRRQFEQRRPFGGAPGTAGTSQRPAPLAPGTPGAPAGYGAAAPGGAAETPPASFGGQRFPGAAGSPQPGQPGADPGGSKKKRRRRRKKKRGMGLHPGAPPSPTVSFWMPADAPMPAPGPRPPPMARPHVPGDPAAAAGSSAPPGAPAAPGPDGVAANGQELGLGKKKRRRRRRRRRGGGGMMGMGQPIGTTAPGAPGAPDPPAAAPTEPSDPPASAAPAAPAPAAPEASAPDVPTDRGEPS